MSSATLDPHTASPRRANISTLAVALAPVGLNLRTGMISAAASVVDTAPQVCLAGGAWAAWVTLRRVGTNRPLSHELLVLVAAVGACLLGGRAGPLAWG